MKKQLQLFFLILILFLGKESLSAQDFTYTIGTGNYLPGESNYLYFKPVSAKSTQVTAKITVTNNTSSAYTVNVDQSSFAQNPAWFPSSNTVSQDIDAGLPATYTITVKIPSNLTGNTATSSTINFDASQDGTGTPDNFSGPTYEVYVYNTAPPTPTIITSQSSATSNSIIVTWAAESSPDAYLTQYTNYINTKIGNNGIGYYQVIIANGSNKQTMPNDTARANVVSYNYSFTNLSSGTLYKITVQAVDVAGNPSALATYSVTTIPPAPSLTVSNINYCGGTLSWSSKGATSYTLFSNGSAIYSGTATSYTVSGLTPGETSPTYYVIATNSSGSSPNSLNENFTTISASAGSITGPSLLCVNSTGTYSSNTMQALNPAPTSIIWSTGSYLTYVSGQGTNSYVAEGTGNGFGYVNLTLALPGCLSNYNYATEYIWAGIPVIESLTGPNYVYQNEWQGPWVISTSASTWFYVCDNWSFVWNLTPASEGHLSFGSGGNTYLQDAFVWVTKADRFSLSVTPSNACGTAAPTVSSYFYAYPTTLALSPNPASSIVTATINSQTNTADTVSSSQPMIVPLNSSTSYSTTYNVRIFNRMGLVVYSSTTTVFPITISVDNLQNGIYTVEVDNNGTIAATQHLTVLH